MARNPRKTSRRGYASIVTSALLVSLSAAIALLGNIRLKGELNRLDTEIGQLDRSLGEQRRSNRKLRMDYETLVSSAGLSSRLQEMQLNLVMPGENARIVLPEPSPESLVRHGDAHQPFDDRLAMGATGAGASRPRP
jgi:hypothetical protein